MNFKVLYFASLRDAAGCASESVASDASDPGGLYAQVATRHGFKLPLDRVRVAVNGAFAASNRELSEDDEIAFLPPVSGG